MVDDDVSDELSTVVTSASAMKIADVIRIPSMSMKTVSDDVVCGGNIAKLCLFLQLVDIFRNI